eukprot:TRINITY_DN13476_c0_g2_i1.p1 TRINITY_DN13476_c0_g2~~TRINITY_DN13476_c0_g2_i1.p1  ORF type:complete len:422 (+),score=59.25 TRINITY_DN13476_c0_g2_i1:130-1395(+)
MLQDRLSRPGRRLKQRRAAALALVTSWLLILLYAPDRLLAMQGPNFSVLFPASYRKKQTLQLTKQVVMQDAKIVLVFAAAGYLVCYSQQRFLCAPHLEKYAPQPPRPEVGALLAAGLYGANVAYNVLNKRLLIAHPNPMLITTVNLGTCSLCCIAAWLLRLQCLPHVSLGKLKILVPLAALNLMGMMCANISVSEVNISFTHTVKATEPFFTAVFTLMLIGGSPTFRSWLGLAALMVGVAVASSTEVSFTWAGFWAAMASNVGVSLRVVLSKLFLTRKDITHPLNVMAVLQCLSFLLSLPLTFLMADSKALSLFNSQTLPVLVSIGPLVWVFNVSSILILSRTSPVTHSMIRTLRRPVLVLASVIAFGGANMSPLNAFGILLALIGAFAFKHDPMWPKARSLPSPDRNTMPEGFRRAESGE